MKEIQSPLRRRMQLHHCAQSVEKRREENKREVAAAEREKREPWERSFSNHRRREREKKRG